MKPFKRRGAPVPRSAVRDVQQEWANTLAASAAAFMIAPSTRGDYTSLAFFIVLFALVVVVFELIPRE